jgi:2-amino-4-hydroxy-6-hydroxymethyldihydropteridine diphosphokinase
MNRVIIGLGSNILPEENIRRALRELAKSMQIIRETGLIRTAPIGITDQPEFLNGAIAAETMLEMDELSALLKNTEDLLGRDRSMPKFGPRTIDLDILSWNGIIIDKDYYTRPFLKALVDELLIC